MHINDDFVSFQTKSTKEVNIIFEKINVSRRSTASYRINNDSRIKNESGELVGLPVKVEPPTNGVSLAGSGATAITIVTGLDPELNVDETADVPEDSGQNGISIIRERLTTTYHDVLDSKAAILPTEDASLADHGHPYGSEPGTSRAMKDGDDSGYSSVIQSQLKDEGLTAALLGEPITTEFIGPLLPGQDRKSVMFEDNWLLNETNLAKNLNRPKEFTFNIPPNLAPRGSVPPPRPHNFYYGLPSFQESNYSKSASAATYYNAYVKPTPSPGYNKDNKPGPHKKVPPSVRNDNDDEEDDDDDGEEDFEPITSQTLGAGCELLFRQGKDPDPVDPECSNDTPIYFTFIGPQPPIQPTAEARRRRSRYAEPIGPVLFDLYREYANRWPGEQSHLIPLDEQEIEKRRRENMESSVAGSSNSLSGDSLNPGGSAKGTSADMDPSLQAELDELISGLTDQPSTKRSKITDGATSVPGSQSDAAGLPSTLAKIASRMKPTIAGLPIGPNGMPERVRSDVPVDPILVTYDQNKEVLRLLMRKRMFRCKGCKNRFIERDIFERHMREKHPDRFEKYKEEKARKEERERLDYLEQLRRQRDIQERREQREAEQYELLIAENEKRRRAGDKDLTFDQMFPVRPTAPRPPQPLSINDDDDGPTTSSGRPRKFKRRICPQCPFCDRRWRDDYCFRRHLAKKHPEAINFVQCNRCYKCVRNPDKMDSHVCDFNWICLECTPIRNLVTAERLNTHKKKFHRGDKSGFKCPDCGRKFLTHRRMRKHRRLNHVMIGHYKCQFCEQFFTSDIQVAMHEREHTGQLRFDCNICDYKCNRSKLTDHKKEDHGYLCVQCKGKFIEWDDVKAHYLSVHGGYISADAQAVFLVSPRLWILYKGE